jgi:pimeloyl-ACP methyl ester carboxylesterase
MTLDILGMMAAFSGGEVTVVGHSNGAAALFWYLALREWGCFAVDYPIDRFVAFDAPLGAVGASWSGWDPAKTQGAASQYITEHGIRGVYAYEVADSLSGPVDCACKPLPDASIPATCDALPLDGHIWFSWCGWTPAQSYYDAHVYLLNNPTPDMIAAL